MKIFIVSLVLAAVLAEDKLAYVFECNRHGARAPLKTPDPHKFKVPTGDLTASGMRQRMLLGLFNRQRYVYHYDLLDIEYNPNQIYVQSTTVRRAIQSGYSQLIGLYPP